MKFLPNIFGALIHLNLSDNDYITLSNDNRRRIRLTNYIGTLSIFNMFTYSVLYSIIDFSLFKPAIFNLIIGCFFIIATMYINKAGKHETAKYMVALLNTLFMFIPAYFIFGKAPSFHVFLLVAAIIPLFLWSIKYIFPLIFIISLNIVLYFFIEYAPTSMQPAVELPENYIQNFRSSSILVCFASLGFAISFFMIIYNKKEKELIEQAEKLKETQQHRDMVYSIIAHDLRSPFSGIIGLSSLLEKNYDIFDDRRKIDSLKNINKSATILNNLLVNLLDWSRIQMGNFKKDFKAFPLIDNLEEVLQILENPIKEKAHTISINIDSNIEVFADYYSVSTIFRNLLTNAIKFTPHSGDIDIIAVQNSEFITIEIKDSGVGLNEDVAKKIFNGFDMFSTLGTNNEKGTGLGLKVCKKYIEANDGELWYKTKKLKGTSFFFTLKNNQTTQT